MSRDKKDMVIELVQAYDFTCKKFKLKYPYLPQPFLTCTHRSNEEQTQLYAQGRTIEGKIITYAKAGESKHNTYLSEAFDIAFITLDKKLDWSEDLFKKFAEIILTLNNIEWGGNFRTFKDFPHFQTKN